MRIRPAEAADAAALATIHVRSWQAAYAGRLPQDFLDGLEPTRRQPVWERSLAEMSWPRRGILVADVDGAVAGFADLRPTRDEDEDPGTVAELVSIYLAPHAWGAGIGRELMAAVLDTAARAGFRHITLWVLDTNDRARRFYDAAGWRPDGTAKQDTIGGARITEIRYRRALDRPRRAGVRT